MPPCSFSVIWTPKIHAVQWSQCRVSNSLSWVPLPCPEPPVLRPQMPEGSTSPALELLAGEQASQAPECLEPRLGKGPEPHSWPLFFFLESFFFFFFLDLHISLGDSYVKGMKTGDGVILNSFWVLFWDLLSYGPFWLDNVYFFIFWPCCVACGILVPRPEIKPQAPAVKVRSLNHWTAREVPSWGLNV